MKRLLMLLLICILLTGCGASGEYAISEVEDNNYTSGFDDMYEGETYGNTDYDYNHLEEYENKSTNEKLVYDCSISIQTTNYDEDKSKLDSLIQEYNATVSYESERDNQNDWYYSSSEKRNGTKSTDIQIRVKSDDYSKFLDDIETIGKVMNKEQSVGNITQSYNDTEVMIDSLHIQENRLLEMYDSANTIEDMITIEKRLTEVQTQLGYYQARLNTMDNNVSYATVNVNIMEVLEYVEEIKEDTFIDRFTLAIKESIKSFGKFLETLLFTLIFLLPFVLLFIVIVEIIVLTVKHKRKSNKKNSDIDDRS